jgi:hypothetical protein
VQAVGSLVHLAVNKGRQARAKSQAVVCGAHTGDPFSVRFFNKIEVDVLCCVPSRLAVAKIAAAQAHIEHDTLYQGTFHNLTRRGGRLCCIIEYDCYFIFLSQGRLP